MRNLQRWKANGSIPMSSSIATENKFPSKHGNICMSLKKKNLNVSQLP
jgi:hypothetical protein